MLMKCFFQFECLKKFKRLSNNSWNFCEYDRKIKNNSYEKRCSNAIFCKLIKLKIYNQLLLEIFFS